MTELREEPFLPTEQALMLLALVEALEAANRQETPVGAVVVDGHGHLLARDGNRTLECHDPTAHGEIRALRQAAHRLGDYRLTGCQLYVTLEPCPMCLEAAAQARLTAIHHAAPRLRDKSPLPPLSSIPQERYRQSAGEMVQQFFAQRRLNR